jgi:hypothetical protein
MARLRRGISSGGRCSCRRGATRPRAFLTPTPTPTVAHEPKNDETPGLLMAVRGACRNLVATLDGHASDAGGTDGQGRHRVCPPNPVFWCRCLPVLSRGVPSRQGGGRWFEPSIAHHQHPLWLAGRRPSSGRGVLGHQQGTPDLGARLAIAPGATPPPGHARRRSVLPWSAV